MKQSTKTGLVATAFLSAALGLIGCTGSTTPEAEQQPAKPKAMVHKIESGNAAALYSVTIPAESVGTENDLSCVMTGAYDSLSCDWAAARAPN